MEEDNLELCAFASSVEEEKRHRAKFPALAVRKATKRALKQGAVINRNDDFDGNSWRFLRTTVPEDSDKTYYVSDSGFLSQRSIYEKYGGVCVAFRPIYNPKSCVIKSLTLRDFTSVVYNEEKNQYEKVTSKNVPIITFGEKEYIWYNREECEKADAYGQSIPMDCESLYLEECILPFDETEISDGYEAVLQRLEQYERVLFEHATEEECSLLCNVIMSRNDNYENLEIVKPYQVQWQDIFEKVKHLETIHRDDEAE